ncbi:MAG: electron transfer flavoprotein subunit alpha/FixB family protein [Chloroflexi bacterium]|nr:electron transfer flavoprotein subunit alpha/FixB family protein [Chloroflexota bacterium]
MNQKIIVIVEHLQGQVNDISYIALAAARELAQEIDGQVVGVLLGHNAQNLANSLSADSVMYADHPALAEFSADAYQKTVAKLIAENEPRAVIFGNTSIGADVASVLSARLSLPLVSSCLKITDGKVTSQICGGKIMTESELGETTTLITMIPGGYKVESGQSESPPEVVSFSAPTLDDLRVILRNYIEPEAGDVDISKEAILVAIGRGIQTEDNIELAEELAELLNGEVCASRPVVDQGWLPTSRMVGKSGQTVKPKLYLALGISGAPEHVEGITESGMIVAINMDPNAPIFDVATYGVELDFFDLIDPLLEQLEEAQG